MSTQEYSWQNIQRRIKNTEYPIGAEIGVHRGELSNQLLKNIQGLTLYMIDAWSQVTYKGKGDDAASPEERYIYENECGDNYENALNIKELYGNRAVVIKGFSLEVAATFDDNFFDFVFIDACHDDKSVQEDIKAWLPKIKDGGWLCGHDYDSNYTGVKKAVDAIFPHVEKDSYFSWFQKIKR